VSQGDLNDETTPFFGRLGLGRLGHILMDVDRRCNARKRKTLEGFTLKKKRTPLFLGV
jgi:hypothetical protein